MTIECGCWRLGGCWLTQSDRQATVFESTLVGADEDRRLQKMQVMVVSLMQNPSVVNCVELSHPGHDII
jgi:hypothetical protein